MKELLSMLLIALSTYAIGADKSATPPPSLVVTTELKKGVVNPLQTYVGTLYYDKQSKLASEEEGTVIQLNVREGQSIKQGDVILELDSEVLKMNIAAQVSAYEALQAELTRQERNLERVSELYKRKAISQTSYDDAFFGEKQLRAQTEAAKHNVEVLKTRLEKRTIRAPYDAVVMARDVEVGEWVGKGTAVVSLAALDTLEARINIPAKLMKIIQNTKSFVAAVEDKEFDVSIKTIVPAADKLTRTFPVEFTVPQDMGLIEGMRIDIKVPTLEKSESFMIPRDGVIKRFGQNVIFANVEGKAVMMPIQVIGYSDNRAGIKGEGLTQGMRIVIKGNERIFPNMPVMEKQQGK